MKKFFYTLLMLVMVMPLSAQESGIKFFHGTWAEAMAKAKQEKKLVFVDFFTEWCGPCLNMALTVFPLPDVGAVYNKDFICLKIDAEKGEGRELAKKYQVMSYPTYIFVNPKTQELLHRSGGNKPAADFMKDVEGALNPKKSSVYLTKIYEGGKYDMNFLKDYITFCKRSGKRNEIESLFAKMISMGAKLTDKDVWNVYVECVSGYKNPYVKQISDNYSQFVSLFGKEAVDAKLAEATRYAPVEFTKSLCDFEGKYYNMKIVNLTSLFRSDIKKAFEETDRLIADEKIDKKEFTHDLSFYVRVNPKYDGDDLDFETLAQKVKYMRYVAYNAYDRDEAMNHYNYAAALEYLIQRSIKEGKQIPAFIYETPVLGKKEYDMRHPLLKQKPGRRKK